MESPIQQASPLLLSRPLSQLMNSDVTSCEVYLKMESSLPTGSFKLRGMWHSCQQAVLAGTKHFVSCSTGNAGVSLCLCAKKLNIPCTIFVPEGTDDKVVRLMRQDGGKVLVGGECYHEANEKALQMEKTMNYTFISSDDYPDTVTGNATLVKELVAQLPSKPGVVVLAVGGGGLLCGVLEGLEAVGWADVPVLGMETKGADCFNLAVKANKIVPLEKITSIAVSIGSRTVSPNVMETISSRDVISEVVTDAQALTSCLRFLDDERVMVEPSCGATLAAVYTGLLHRLVDEGRLTTLGKDRPVVVVVCGGTMVTIKQLQEWAQELDVPFPYTTQQ